MKELVNWKIQLHILETDMRINENKAEAEKFLKTNNFSLDHPKYLGLKDMLTKDNTLGYLGTFTRWLFEYGEPSSHVWELLMNIYTAIQEDKSIIKALPQPLTTYSNIVEASAAVSKAEDIRGIKRFIDKAVYDKTVRAQFLQNGVNKYEFRREFIKNIKYFDQITDEDRNVFLKKASRYKDAQSWYEAFKAHIEGLQSGFYYENVLSKMQGFGDEVKVLYSDPEKEWILARIHTYYASKNLGSAAWCIVGSEQQWNNYVDYPGNIQYFFFDFQNAVYDNRVIGVTMTEENELYAAHDRADNGFPKADQYLKNLGVMPKIKEVNTREFALKLKKGVEKLNTAPERASYESESMNKYNVVHMVDDYVYDSYGSPKKNTRGEYIRAQQPDKQQYQLFLNISAIMFLGKVSLGRKGDAVTDNFQNIDLVFETYQNVNVHFIVTDGDYDDWGYYTKVDHTKSVNIVEYVLGNYEKSTNDITKRGYDQLEEYILPVPRRDFNKLFRAQHNLEATDLAIAVKSVYERGKIKLLPETKRVMLQFMRSHDVDVLASTRTRKGKTGEDLTPSEFGVSAKQGTNHTAKVMDKINRFRRGEDVQMSQPEIVYAIEHGYGDFFKEHYTKLLSDDPHMRIDYEDMQIMQKVGLTDKMMDHVVRKAEVMGYGMEGLNSIEASIYQHAKYRKGATA